MANRLSVEHVSSVLKQFLANSKTGPLTDAVIFHNFSAMDRRIQSIQGAFPESSLHAIAVKANPLAKVLERIIGRNSEAKIGLEVASRGEFHLAELARTPKHKIVFDSPVKSLADLIYALNSGCLLNADSIQELAKIADLVDRGHGVHGAVGVRLNPQVGVGQIAATSVAGEFSKLGVPLDCYRRRLIDCYLRYPWLRTVHLHVGSQGCAPGLLIEGVKKIVDFCQEANCQIRKHGTSTVIDQIDIGGGLGVAYRDTDSAWTVEDYAQRLYAEVPALGQFSVVTEFGRYVHANAGWAVSRVESVKNHKQRPTAMIHLGADLLLRRCYRPEDWFHELTVFDRLGEPKTGVLRPYVVAGPLCFADDILARSMALPLIEEGDFMVIHDVGAYTYSMWSCYNSRRMPAIYGYEEQQSGFQLLRQADSLQDIASFWGYEDE